MAKKERATSRTGPSPSSGKRRSFEPMRKEPPINGDQRRAMGVALGLISITAAAAAGSAAGRFAQQLGFPSAIRRRLLLLLFFPERRLALRFHQRENFFARDHAAAIGPFMILL